MLKPDLPTRVAYVAFAGTGEPVLSVAGKLGLPASTAPRGAVLICHGSDGVDGRGAFHAEALNAAGVATLEIDMWAARGSGRGAAARPSSPLDTLGDAFGALAFLAAQPEIDAARIGVMGFSWGGVVTLVSSRRRHVERFSQGGLRFAAHAAFYPVCWAYEHVPALSLEGRTGSPILIQTGEADTYDAPDSGARLVEHLRAVGEGEVTGYAYANATHGFDRDLPAQVINDPFSHQGKGGPVTMTFHPEAAALARARCLAFFLSNLS